MVSHPDEVHEAASALLMLSQDNPCSEVDDLKMHILEINKRHNIIKNGISKSHIQKPLQIHNWPNYQQFAEPIIGDIRLPEMYPFTEINKLMGKCSKPFEKILTDSDVNDGQSRIILRKKDVKDCINPLLKESEKIENGIDVIVYGKEEHEHKMVLKIWNGKVNVLTTGWRDFCEKYSFKKDDVVKIWAFRNLKTGKLCFVIMRTN